MLVLIISLILLKKKGHWGPKAEGERAFKNFVGTAGG